MMTSSEEDDRIPLLDEEWERKMPSYLSEFFFWWPMSVFAKGYKRDLAEDDLQDLPEAYESHRLGNRLQGLWQKELRARKKPKLLRALRSAVGVEFLVCGQILMLVECAIKFTHPFLLKKVMEYYGSNSSGVTEEAAYANASLIVILLFLSVFFSHHYSFAMEMVSMKMRVACCSLIYRKALRLSQGSVADTSAGQIVNLISNDVSKFDQLVTVHILWVGPLLIFGTFWFLWDHIGGSAGAAMLLIFIPVQIFMARKSSKFRRGTAYKTDQRIRLISEILSGIRLIRMYVWEKPFAKLVYEARKLELNRIKWASYIRAVNISFPMFINRSAVFLCIVTYILTGNRLNAEYVYVVISYYGLMQNTVCLIPMAVTALVETKVSIDRIEKFLKQPEVVEREEVEPSSTVRLGLRDFSVTWKDAPDSFALSRINLEAGPRQLIGVIGPVGSGKTTLLNGVLQELEASEGRLNVTGHISYAPQEPWLFAGTIRKNILFGLAFDEKRYSAVVAVCGLERDLRELPNGDKTFVGERGVMLSGGQKARISLARAIYRPAHIYLLDDPLSAVDPQVASHIFEHCILGYLRDKCTILVTHQLRFLRKASKIYLLENGRVTASGRYEDISRGTSNSYLKLLETRESTKDEKQDEATATEEGSVAEDPIVEEEMKVTEAEKRASGKVSSGIYWRYIKAGGHFCCFFLVVLLFFFAQLGSSSTDYFVAFWVNLVEDKNSSTNTSNATKSTSHDMSLGTLFEDLKTWLLTSHNAIYVYALLIISTTLTRTARNLTFFRFCISASKNLHNRMASRIIYACMRFFNANPSGRILNRFSKDIGLMDELLPITILYMVQTALVMVGTATLVCLINPWSLVPTVLMLVLFYWYRQVYVASSRDLKRMEGTTRSPVVSHLTTSLQGLSTIRSHDAVYMMSCEFDRRQDRHTTAFYTYTSSSRSFGFWLDMHCALYAAIVLTSFLLLSNDKHGGDLGLTLTQLVGLLGVIQYGMKQWSELENQMTSVERVVEYIDEEYSEESYPDNPCLPEVPPEDWPQQGKIVFNSVSLFYHPSLLRVLKFLDFEIEPKQKIGIVGRTGSGKSSLISALFRLAETDGDLVIDGIEHKQVPHRLLRSKMTIIPQDPVLFSGTLRRNLDPSDQYEDSTLWSALADVELKDHFSDCLGLQTVISEGGCNFSVGQKQLICLARAIVRNNKILILDEATANVDPQTDRLIQKTIRTKFSECTVLTIAHRIQTIMDSDKVLVMSNGRVVEFDSPQVLLEAKGYFYRLVSSENGRFTEGL